MVMLWVLVVTAFSRHIGASHLRSTKTVPALQPEDEFHNDFVHDDTAHPEEAVKVNIKESEARLKEAEKEIDGLKDRFEEKEQEKEDALKAHDDHQAEVDEAKKMVAKLKEEIASAPSAKAGLAKATEKVSVANKAVNQTDIAATAAAETVKQAQRDLHERIMNLVDAKENRSDAEEEVRRWEARIEDSGGANKSLDMWEQKYNASLRAHASLQRKVNETDRDFKEIHEDWKTIEARVAEAQKIFDIDREQYEEYIGPYPAPSHPKENLWWDALTEGRWHEPWSKPSFF